MMLGRILPPPVVVAEAFADIEGEQPYPGEEELIARAVEGRRREFVTGRRCAREALAVLGFAPAPIGRGPKREPVWPAGVVGSITHCTGFRAAAVARGGEVASLGIDAEPHGPLPEGVFEPVTVPVERVRLGLLTQARPDVHWGRVLFSAKESVYKAWYPLTGRWLGFEEASLTIDPDRGEFRAELLSDGTRIDGGEPLTELRGRFLVDRGLVVTAVTVGA